MKKTNLKPSTDALKRFVSYLNRYVVKNCFDDSEYGMAWKWLKPKIVPLLSPDSCLERAARIAEKFPIRDHGALAVDRDKACLQLRKEIASAIRALKEGAK